MVDLSADDRGVVVDSLITVYARMRTEPEKIALDMQYASKKDLP